MNTMFKFTAAKLPNNKQGLLKPDSDGYYQSVIGGLNVFNSNNQFYTLEGAKELFEASNVFMRRIQRGAVKGEVGHPRRETGMADSDYINRLFEIRETNTCVQFADITLDIGYGNSNGQPGVVAIIGKYIPSGPFGPALEKALLNPKENVCFSLRGLTNDFFAGGRYNKTLTQIICWDWVTEPGIAIAEKYKSPSLEHTASLMLEDLESTAVSIDELEKILVPTSHFSLEHSEENIRESLRIMRKYENKQYSKLFGW